MPRGDTYFIHLEARGRKRLGTGDSGGVAPESFKAILGRQWLANHARKLLEGLNDFLLRGMGP